MEAINLLTYTQNCNKITTDLLLKSGWNLISGSSTSNMIIQSNDNISTNSLYYFSDTYKSSNIIEPYFGYWIHNSSSDNITITLEEI